MFSIAPYIRTVYAQRFQVQFIENNLIVFANLFRFTRIQIPERSCVINPLILASWLKTRFIEILLDRLIVNTTRAHVDARQNKRCVQTIFSNNTGHRHRRGCNNKRYYNYYYYYNYYFLYTHEVLNCVIVVIFTPHETDSNLLPNVCLQARFFF